MRKGYSLFSVVVMLSLVGRTLAFVARPNVILSRTRQQQQQRLLVVKSTTTRAANDQAVKDKHATKTYKIQTTKKQPAQEEPPLINLYTISKEDLQDIIQMWGYPKYRADQVYHWIRDKGIVDVDQMQNVPKKLRQDLVQFSTSSSTTRPGETTNDLSSGTDSDSTGGALEVVREQVSPKDGTIKRLYRLKRDGLLIESVLMPYEDGRWTTCISSQAGCAQGCVFCATGQMGFQRQLTADEIVEQVTRFSTLLKSKQQLPPPKQQKHNNKSSSKQQPKHNKQQRLSNVVFMGEGEPLANFRNVMEAVPRIQELAGIGARKITISTVGIVPNIRKLMQSPIQVRLAVSLHCANDEERSALLPANQRYGGLNELMTTLYDYIETTGRRLTVEWALIQGENDTPQMARQLGNLLREYRLRRDMVHVNVIPLNPTGGYSGSASGKKRVNEFIRVLEEEFGVACTPRVRRGIDIDAGCGQLKSKELNLEKQQQEAFPSTRKKEEMVSHAMDTTTLDLDSDAAAMAENEDGVIMDENFDPDDAKRLISMVQGTVIKDADLR